MVFGISLSSLVILFAFFILFNSPKTAKALTVCTWTGAIDSNWNNEGNWSGCLPDTVDEVAYFDSTAKSITIPAGTSIGELETTAGFTGTLATGGALTVVNFKKATGSSFALSANHTLTITGQIAIFTSVFVAATGSTVDLTNETVTLTSNGRNFFNLKMGYSGQTVTLADGSYVLINGTLTTENGTIVKANANSYLIFYTDVGVSNALVNNSASPVNLDTNNIYFEADASVEQVNIGKFNLTGALYVRTNHTQTTYNLTGPISCSLSAHIYPNSDNKKSILDTNGYDFSIAGSLIVGNASSPTRNGKLIIDDSIVSITGSVTISNGGGNNEIAFTETNGLLKIGGDYLNSDILTSGSSGTIEFNKSSGTQSVVSGGTGDTKAFNNFIHSGEGTLTTMTNGIDINGDLGLTFGILNMNVDYSIGGNVSIASGATIINPSPNLIFDGTSVATYTDLNPTMQLIGYVTIAKNSPNLANNKLTMLSSMNLTKLVVNADNTFDLGSGGYTLKITGNGASSEVLTNNGTFNPGTSLVDYAASNSGGDVEIANVAFSSLTLSGSDTYILIGNQTETKKLTGSLTINTGSTLKARPVTTDYDLETDGDISISGTYSIVDTTSQAIIKCRDLTINDSALLNGSGSTAGIEITRTWTNLVGTFITGSTAVRMTGDGNIINTNSGLRRFYDLYIAYEGKTTTIGVNGNNSSGGVVVLHQLISGSGSVNTAISYSAILVVETSISDPYLTDASSPAVFNTALQTIIRCTNDCNIPKANFGVLYLNSYATNKNVTYTLTGDLSTSNYIIVYSGKDNYTSILDTNNHFVTVVGGGMEVGTNEGSGNNTKYGKVILRSGTYAFSESVIIFNNSHSGTNILEVTEDDALIQTKSWINGDTFTSNEKGTVQFISVADSLITGETNFHNFKVDTTNIGNKRIAFEANKTQTLSGDLLITADLEHRLSLIRYMGSGSDQWTIDIPSSILASIRYTSVENSTVADNNTIKLGLGSTIGANTAGWYLNTAPSAPSNLSPSIYTDGTTWTNNTTPTLTFYIANSDPGEQAQYEIQIASDSNFTVPIIVYKSSPVSPGEYSFTVGQDNGSGNYFYGDQNSRLTENIQGGFFWRVRTIDTEQSASSYTIANASLPSIKIDISAPSAPGIPTLISAINDSTPTWGWESSSDQSSNVAKYFIRLGSTIDGFDIVNETDINTATNWTCASNLLGGTYYFGVRAQDNAGNLSDWSISKSVINISAPRTVTSQTSEDYQLQLTVADISNVFIDKYLSYLYWQEINQKFIQETASIEIYRNNKLIKQIYQKNINEFVDKLDTYGDFEYEIKYLDNKSNILMQSAKISISIAKPAEKDIDLIVVPSKISTDKTSAVVGWQTELPALGWVKYNKKSISDDQYVSSGYLNTDHIAVLTDLDPKTTYRVQASSSDVSNNKSISKESYFNSSSAISQERTKSNLFLKVKQFIQRYFKWFGLSQAQAKNDEYKNIFKPFIVYDLSPIVLSPKIIVVFDDNSNMQISSEGSIYTDIVKTGDNYSLIEADSDKTYSFKNDQYKFSLNPDNKNQTAPNISNIKVLTEYTMSDDDSAQIAIVWNTDQYASSQIEFGMSNSYGENTIETKSNNTQHIVTLNNLKPHTTYHFRVVSGNGSSKKAISKDYSFKTK